MKINFAQVPKESLDTNGTDTLFGPDTKGNYYYNYVEFGTNAGGTDEISIVDTCDRYMPIAVESIPELIAALECYLAISNSIKVSDNINYYVNSDNEGYTNVGADDDTTTKVKFDEPFPRANFWPFPL